MSSKFGKSNNRSNSTENHFNEEKMEYRLKTSNNQFMVLELPERFTPIFGMITEEVQFYKAYQEKHPDNIVSLVESVFYHSVNNKNAFYYIDAVSEIYSNILDDERRQLFCEEIKQNGDSLETVSDILGTILKYVAVFQIEGITDLTQLGKALVSILNCIGNDIPNNEQEYYKRGLEYVGMNRVIVHEGKYYYILSVPKKQDTDDKDYL